MTVMKRYNAGTSQWETIVVGKQGPVGQGVPVGGAAGQVLAKASGTDYDGVWANSFSFSTDSISSGREALGLPNTTFVSQGGNRNYAASTLCVWPFVVSNEITVTSWVADVRTNTAGTTTTLRAGIYEWNDDISLGALVTEFPLLSVPASTTSLYVTALAAPLTLAAGRYAIAWNVSSATPTFRTPQAASPFVRFTQTNNMPARFAAPNGTVNVANPLPSSGPTIFIGTDAINWGPSVFIVWGEV